MVTQVQKEIMSHYDITIHGTPDALRITNNDVLVIEPPFEFRSCAIDASFLGAFTYIGGGSTIIKNVGKIGRFCSIASNQHFGPVEHPSETISAHPMLQREWHTWKTLDAFYSQNEKELIESKKQWNLEKREKFPKINIGNNVWIGEGVFIRQGVQVGDGAIIASRSVVTKDVPAYSIVGGNPAKVIKMRYNDSIIEKMNKLQWWNYGTNALHGVEFHSLDKSLSKIEENISAGAKLYNPICLHLDKGGLVKNLKQI